MSPEQQQVQSDQPDDTRPEIHHHHRNVSGGWLRPAVFGAMDGLVSNASLIAGVAGGSASQHTVLLTGLAGLFAGAFSMAAGEYTSVASQSELVAAEIEVERRELDRRPHAEQHELALLYESRGVAPDLAREVARQLSSDPEQAWRIHAREELGVDPDELPQPLVAAGSSFASFALGALLPLLPYAIGGGHLLAIAFAISAVALFALGVMVARFTRRSPWFSGARQLAFGVAAAAVTYAIGSAVGTGVG